MKASLYQPPTYSLPRRHSKHIITYPSGDAYGEKERERGRNLTSVFICVWWGDLIYIINAFFAHSQHLLPSLLCRPPAAASVCSNWRQIVVDGKQTVSDWLRSRDEEGASERVVNRLAFVLSSIHLFVCLIPRDEDCFLAGWAAV